jgi:hypothetical protein
LVTQAPHLLYTLAFLVAIKTLASEAGRHPEVEQTDAYYAPGVANTGKLGSEQVRSTRYADIATPPIVLNHGVQLAETLQFEGRYYIFQL